jgi:acetoin utilization protein AcuB
MFHTRRVSVCEYMTSSLLTADRAEPISSAYERLNASGVGQLPVLDTGELVGVVSQGDLALVGHLPGRALERITVGAVMNREFYTVRPGEAVDVAAREMAKHKYHAAVVVEGGHPRGVFTTTDALRALSDSLTGSLPGEDAQD